MKNIIFINSHPIQYFAPMYKYMNEKGLPVHTWYASDGLTGKTIDKEFGVKFTWDIPMLDGYPHEFFENVSWKPSHATGFFGLINPKMVLELFKIPSSVIVVHGWHYFTHLLIIFLAKLKGHTVCLRNETPFSHEQTKGGWKQLFKRFVFKNFLFSRVDYFLAIGTQNKLFYKSYGIPEERLVLCPYSVDNNRFKTDYVKLIHQKNSLKKELGIPSTDKIILYSGKYISKKRPMDLLRAFEQLNDPTIWLVMVGEGELRREMEQFIKASSLDRVLLTGFVNQGQISEYYIISDVFVMCSTVGETWGLSVNEAMNFDLPVVISDLTGCSSDLVQDGNNGYVFSTGNVDELTTCLKRVLLDKQLSFSPSSKDIIDKYSYASITESFLSIFSKDVLPKRDDLVTQTI